MRSSNIPAVATRHSASLTIGNLGHQLNAGRHGSVYKLYSLDLDLGGGRHFVI